MTLELHQECKTRLVESIIGVLKGAKVTNGILLNWLSVLRLEDCDKIIPAGRLTEKLIGFVGDNPVSEFVYETITRDLQEREKYNSDDEAVSLTSLQGYSDLQATASSLVDEFDSLPFSYTVFCELGQSLGSTLRTVVPKFIISDKLQIVSPDGKYNEIFPLQSGIKGRDDNLFGGRWSPGRLFPSKEERKWNEDTSLIRLDIDGFIGQFGQTTPIKKVLSNLKAFFGLSLAINLFRVRQTAFDWPFNIPSRNYLIIFKKHIADDNWVIWRTADLPDDFSHTVNSLELENFDEEIDASAMEKWMSSRIEMLASAFGNPYKAEKVLLAGEWLFDSYLGKNELLSFVQTAVAMEILLGEDSKSDILGIGELLRNRCAYLIGKTYDERKEILEAFNKIYGVRSKIVHRGKSTLTSAERKLFFDLRYMCQRVMIAEINLILRDKQ